MNLNIVKNLQVKALDKKIEKTRIDAIVKQTNISFEMPDGFMKLKKCNYVKTIESCSYYKNVLNEIKVVLPPKTGLIICKPDGSVELEIFDRKNIIVKQEQGRTLPYFKAKVYSVEV